MALGNSAVQTTGHSGPVDARAFEYNAHRRHLASDALAPSRITRPFQYFSSLRSRRTTAREFRQLLSDVA